MYDRNIASAPIWFSCWVKIKSIAKAWSWRSNIKRYWATIVKQAPNSRCRNQLLTPFRELKLTKQTFFTLTSMIMLWARVPVISGRPLPGKKLAAIPDQGPRAITTTSAWRVSPLTTTPETWQINFIYSRYVQYIVSDQPRKDYISQYSGVSLTGSGLRDPSKCLVIRNLSEIVLTFRLTRPPYLKSQKLNKWDISAFEHARKVQNTFL